jgi:NAD(P)H-hydrate epimerase
MPRDYHIGWPQMLETTGRSLAQLACDLLGGEVLDRPIVVLAGRGPNGGGGLAAARCLLNWGGWVQVVCSHPAAAYRGAPRQQLAALQAMGAALAWAEDGWELPPCDLLIDAVIGHGLAGDPRGPERSLIALANSNAAPILSLDVPSGVDGEAGRLFTPHIRAAATLALALPMAGLRAPVAAAACGDLYLADIGAPAALLAQLGIAAPPLFTCNSIIPLHVEDEEIWVKE